MIGWAPATLMLLSSLLQQDPEPGISKALAEARANRVSEVRYELYFKLDEGIEEVGGTVTCRFELSEHGAGEKLVIDFGGNTLSDVAVNGHAVAHPKRVHDHLILPAELLQPGANSFSAAFTSPVAPTGTALTRYDDAGDGSTYLYTLLVPGDAHRLFPCFDQPDLKARFQLSLEIPDHWRAIGNGAPGDSLVQVTNTEIRPIGPVFVETKPISTYLFAFAAGPFEEVADEQPSGIGADPERPLRLYTRKSQLEHLDAPRLFEMHRDSLQWLEEFFGTPYPFGKLDFVLLPGFPYGGMEHAGAIFYRERSMVFEREPTKVERHRRSTLVYHEVSHQWFGNLVTMRWFDDLWLKEGFATFIGYRVLEQLEPDSQAWLRFLQRIKPPAYRIDATDGTTPIWQELGNLDDAKSAYGPIVYNKAPAILRELEARLGEEPFRNGVQLFLQRFAYDNARWQDLIAAFRDASEMRGSRWSDRWILTAGMPRVRAEWTAADGEIASFAILQENAGEQPWPLSLDILLLDEDGDEELIRVQADAARNEIAELVGEDAPAAVLLNPGDVAYGEFVLDARSLEFLVGHFIEIEDPLVRAVTEAALWQAVRDAELDPAVFAAQLIERLKVEDDPQTYAGLLGKLGACLGRYLAPARSEALRQSAEELLRADLQAGRAGSELQILRFLAGHGRSPATIELLGQLFDEGLELPGLTIDRRDRFLLAAALLANGDSEAVDREVARLPEGVDAGKETFLAKAAAPDPAVKAQYFTAYLQLGQPPEQWMQDSLGYFHWSGQSELTLSWLDNALEQLLWVKKNRRIFFMPAWIDAFVNAHASPDAIAVVERYMGRHPDLPIDVRRKLLQSMDGLQRAVRIRARFPNSGR